MAADQPTIRREKVSTTNDRDDAGEGFHVREVGYPAAVRSYAWMAGRQAREVRRQADRALAHEITVIHLALRKSYGVPRVTAALRR
ncbi:hypothetical protein GCM10022295_93060 [Streptomyces osmaniensis]|uniref:Transposase n=1 Tax=Streptomyces osmaniensis TaxID=593134 RepID=A0ABP6Z5I9_9ACTN